MLVEFALSTHTCAGFLKPGNLIQCLKLEVFWVFKILIWVLLFWWSKKCCKMWLLYQFATCKIGFIICCFIGSCSFQENSTTLSEDFLSAVWMQFMLENIILLDDKNRGTPRSPSLGTGGQCITPCPAHVQTLAYAQCTSEAILSESLSAKFTHAPCFQSTVQERGHLPFILNSVLSSGLWPSSEGASKLGWRSVKLKEFQSG